MKTKQNNKLSFFNRHKKAIIFGIIILIAVFLIGGVIKKQNSRETYTVSRETLQESFSATGEVEAQSEALMQFGAPSKVVWVGVKTGDMVKKWQGLASVDQRTLKKNLERALSYYMTSRWDLEDARDTQNVTSNNLNDFGLSDSIKRQLEKYQFSLDRSVLDVELSDIAKQEAVLVSPISGTIVDDGNLVVGENIGASQLAQKAIRIVDLNTLYFDAKVDEIDFSKLVENQPVTIELDAYPNQMFSGSIAFIGKQGVESVSGIVSVPVEVKFDEAPEKLVTGLNGEAFFITNEKKDILAVPEEYIVTTEQKPYALVKRDGRTQKQTVEVGIVAEGMQEIITGLSEGEVIVKPK